MPNIFSKNNVIHADNDDGVTIEQTHFFNLKFTSIKSSIQKLIFNMDLLNNMGLLFDCNFRLQLLMGAMVTIKVL